MPQIEQERLKTVHRFLNLKIRKKQELQEIVELAAELCGTQSALITLIKDGKHLIKFKAGKNLHLDLFIKNVAWDSFFDEDILIILNMLQDERTNVGDDKADTLPAKFYAGVPLVMHDGHMLGMICVLDSKTQQLTDPQKHLLKVLAKRVVQFMEFEVSICILKKQFTQAKDAEIKLRSFFESSVACHVLIGKEMEVLAYNKNMAKLLKGLHQVNIFIGMTLDRILKDEHLKAFVVNYRKALKGKTVSFEQEAKYPTGELIWWNVSFEPGYDQRGDIIGVSYNASDITERKLYEQQILAQNESFKKIAHIQSHELRKPVASILGLVNLFKAEGYSATAEELKILEIATNELDVKIRAIVSLAD